MLNVANRLLKEIISDFYSCWYFAVNIFNNPPIDKRIIFIIVIAILLFPFLVISGENGIFLYFVRVLLASLLTFLILTWSNTFWFLMKKSWMYKIHVKKRESINYYLKDIKKLKVESTDADNPEEALYIISNYNSEGFKYHAIRNAVEVGLILVILLMTMPLIFLFNLSLVCLQFFYVMIFDNQSSGQIFNDLKTLVYCVYKLYKNNPEDCKKLIFESKIQSMKELSFIYKAIEKANK